MFAGRRNAWCQRSMTHDWLMPLSARFLLLNGSIWINSAMTVTGRSSMRSAERSAEKDFGILQLGAANHWHALHTRYQHEKAVVQALSSKGHNVFLPLYGATHLWRRRPMQLQLPLFPGYLFIQGGIDRQLQILSTPGVISIVKSGGLPAIVPPEQIAAVRRIVERFVPRRATCISTVWRSRDGYVGPSSRRRRDFGSNQRGVPTGRFHGIAGQVRRRRD